jgi:hypothetical protein
VTLLVSFVAKEGTSFRCACRPIRDVLPDTTHHSHSHSIVQVALQDAVASTKQPVVQAIEALSAHFDKQDLWQAWPNDFAN